MKLWHRRIGHKGQTIWLPSILIRFFRDLWNIREPSFEALVRSLLMFYDHHHEHRGTAGAARQPLNPGLDGLQFTIVHSIGFMTNTKYQGRNYVWSKISIYQYIWHLQAFYSPNTKLWMMFIYLGFYMQILLLDIYISVFWLLIVWNN